MTENNMKLSKRGKAILTKEEKKATREASDKSFRIWRDTKADDYYNALYARGIDNEHSLGIHYTI